MSRVPLTDFRIGFTARPPAGEVVTITYDLCEITTTVPGQQCPLCATPVSPGITHACAERKPWKTL